MKLQNECLIVLGYMQYGSSFVKHRIINEIEL